MKLQTQVHSLITCVYASSLYIYANIRSIKRNKICDLIDGDKKGRWPHTKLLCQLNKHLALWKERTANSAAPFLRLLAFTISNCGVKVESCYIGT